MERKNGKGKQKKAKTSASAHVASKKEAKKAQCLWYVTFITPLFQQEPSNNWSLMVY